MSIMDSSSNRIRDYIKKANNMLKDRKIVAVYMYEKNSVLIEAPRKGTTTDYDGSFFLLTKNSCRYFSPFDDYDRFIDAINNHKINVSGV